MFWRQFNLTDRIFLFVCLRCCLKRKDECLWCHQRISHVKQDYFLIRLCNFQDIFFLIEMISNRCFIVQKKKYKLQVIFHIDIRRKYDFFFSSLFFLTNLHPRRKLSFRNLLNFFHEYLSIVFIVVRVERSVVTRNPLFDKESNIRKHRESRKKEKDFSYLTYSFIICSIQST
jgi:hypothetical protein